MDMTDDLNLRLDDGGHRMFAAPTGGGKSYTVGAFIERLYDEEIPFIVLDTKTENHIGLVELPKLKKLSITPRLKYKNLAALKDYPYILCVPASKTIPIKDIISIYRDIVNYLWLHDGDRVFIVEEAHNWSKNSSVPDALLEQIAREGRSSNQFVWFITQRLQNFSQLLWSQCSYTYLWHFNIPSDIRYASQIVPNFEQLNRDQLKRHDVLVWDNQEPRIIKAAEITRRTKHRG